MTLTADYLNSIFKYENGFLFWKVSKGAVKAGKKVASINSEGRYTVAINGKSYLVHRVIFCMHHGFFPEQVDHIDGNCINNLIENLREATHSQNAQNAKTRFDNACGLKNITYNSQYKKWYVRVGVNKKRLFLGSFDDLELAQLVATEARDLFHGKFANHGEKYAI